MRKCGSSSSSSTRSILISRHGIKWGWSEIVISRHRTKCMGAREYSDQCALHKSNIIFNRVISRHGTYWTCHGNLHNMHHWAMHILRVLRKSSNSTILLISIVLLTFWQLPSTLNFSHSNIITYTSDYLQNYVVFILITLELRWKYHIFRGKGLNSIRHI